MRLWNYDIDCSQFRIFSPAAQELKGANRQEVNPVKMWKVSPLLGGRE